tara:strand:+ start:537 stop:1115 length:579 start_codon:yes stop_codon:yes gene_type:complete
MEVLKKKFNTFPFQYFPKYYEKEGLLNEIKNNINFNQDRIVVGKDNIERQERRKTCWLSNDKSLTFEYSGKSMKPEKIPEVLNDMIELLNSDFGIKFDGILVNYYENGQVGMGYHSDPIDNKWENNFIVYSIGGERKFIFREKDNIDTKIDYIFGNGDLIFMYEDCQDRYEHSIRKNKDESERISLVFKKKL